MILRRPMRDEYIGAGGTGPRQRYPGFQGTGKPSVRIEPSGGSRKFGAVGHSEIQLSSLHIEDR